VLGCLISFCCWFIQVKLPVLGTESLEEKRKLEKLRRKRDREAMRAKGSQKRKVASSLDSVPEVSSVDETDLSHSYEDLESKSRTVTEEIGHDIRTSEAYKR